jgi:excisionase family DNA binding protein
MRALIRRYRIDPTASDEVIRQVIESFMPLIKEVPGLLSYYALDTREGTIVTIAICKDRTAIETVSKKATEWIGQNLASLLLANGYSSLVGLEEILHGNIYGGAPESLGTGTSNPSESHVEGLQLLSVDQVCEILGMGKSWVYRKIRSGEIPSVKLGRAIKVNPTDLKEYLDTQHGQP